MHSLTLGDWADRLIYYDYIKRGDCGKVFGGPGVPLWDGTGQLRAANSAFKVFKITNADPGKTTIFLESRNYTYNRTLDSALKPFGDTAFVVTRKDTSSAHYSKSQYGQWPLIGTLTGQPPNAQQPAAEDASMILP
jgi:hypothetical protein